MKSVIINNHLQILANRSEVSDLYTAAQRSLEIEVKLRQQLEQEIEVMRRLKEENEVCHL